MFRMSISNIENLGVQQNFNPQFQEKFIPLAYILDGAIQRTYHQLMIMTDM